MTCPLPKHPAAQVLDTVQANLDGLSASCSRIGSVLASTKASTGALLSETERLQTELEAVERKSNTVAGFLDQYQLSAEEVGEAQESQGWKVELCSRLKECNARPIVTDTQPNHAGGCTEWV